MSTSPEEEFWRLETHSYFYFPWTLEELDSQIPHLACLWVENSSTIAFNASQISKNNCELENTVWIVSQHKLNRGHPNKTSSQLHSSKDIIALNNSIFIELPTLIQSCLLLSLLDMFKHGCLFSHDNLLIWCENKYWEIAVLHNENNMCSLPCPFII